MSLKKIYTIDNLNFKILKLKRKSDINSELMEFRENNIIATILSQKTNSVEGNTINLIDTYNVINKKEVKGNYKFSETYEIINLYNVYYNILENGKTYKDKSIHYVMYKDIFDINFYKGEYKKVNNFTTETRNREKVEIHYIDKSSTKDFLKLNNNYLKSINELENKEDILINLLIWHCNFETIHPFTDGNGRVGRVLLDQELLKNDLLPLLLNNNYKELYFSINNQIREKEFNLSFIESINKLLTLSNQELKISLEKLNNSIEKKITCREKFDSDIFE